MTTRGALSRLESPTHQSRRRNPLNPGRVTYVGWDRRQRRSATPVDRRWDDDDTLRTSKPTNGSVRARPAGFDDGSPVAPARHPYGGGRRSEPAHGDRLGCDGRTGGPSSLTSAGARPGNARHRASRGAPPAGGAPLARRQQSVGTRARISPHRRPGPVPRRRDHAPGPGSRRPPRTRYREGSRHGRRP